MKVIEKMHLDYLLRVAMRLQMRRQEQLSLEESPLLLFLQRGYVPFSKAKGRSLSERTHSLKHGDKSSEWQLNTSVYADLSVLDST